MTADLYYEVLGAYYDAYGAQAGERPDMGGTQRYAAIHTEGPGAAEVERRRAEIDAWQQQMAEEARQKAAAERAARDAERRQLAAQQANDEAQRRMAEQRASEEEQRRIAEQKAYEAEQQRQAQEEYQRQLAEYERQKAQYERDMARYQQEKAAYDAEMARRAAQNDAQPVLNAEEGAPRRRRAAQKPKTYSDYVSGETVEQLPDPPRWPQVQQAAEEAKKPKKGIMSRMAKMMEDDDDHEISGINALPPRVSRDEAYRPAKKPTPSGKRKR